MTFLEKLNRRWHDQNTMVCVGLDPDRAKLPEFLQKEPEALFRFNRAIIDATAPYACCFKPQAAYYAGQNADAELIATIEYVHANYPEIPVILDVKRGDIGATAEQYAKEAFDRYAADAVTVNPYMGTDALTPFLRHADRGVIILCRTSNPGGADLQNLKVDGDRPLYQHVALLARDRWNQNGNVMLVVGATVPDELKAIRGLCPEMPFLVPGVGAQGGDAAAVVRNGEFPQGGGLAVNSSRGIIYASHGEDFAEAAGRAACQLRDQLREASTVRR